MMQDLPTGLVNAAIALCLFALAVSLFIIMLRRQVLRATCDIHEHQERLRESESLLTQAQAVGHVGSWKLNIATSTLWASEEACRIYGIEHDSPYLSLDQAEGITLNEDRMFLDAALRGLIQKKYPYDIEYRIQRANDKQIRVIHSMANLVPDAGGAPVSVTGLLQDITERKRGEEELRETHQLLRRVLDATPQCICWKNYNLEFLGCNRNYANLIGLSNPNDIIHKTEADFLPNEQACFSMAGDRKAIETDKPDKEILERRVGSDGRIACLETSKIPLHDPHGNVDGILTICTDVTERKRAEEILQESEMFLRQTEAIARVGGWKANPHTDFAVLTQGINHILDLPSDCRPGFTEALNYFLPQYAPILREKVLHTLATDEPFVEECEVNTPLKDRRWVEVRGLTSVSIADETYVIGTFQDITDRKKLDKEKSKLEQQFQQAQKMESVGRLASGVAHDLNNLLTPVLGFGELLREEFARNDPRRASMEQIVEAGNRARDLVRQLLAFSRKQLLEFKPLNLDNTVQAFARLLRHTIREDIAIDYKSEPELPQIRGDIGQLEQVIMNLAVNAQDAMPEGGTLNIEISMAELDEFYAMAHPSVIPGRYILLAFSDTGHGMDADVKEHLFEPFFTTKEKGKGTGLGLATTYGIIKQHGGNIWVYSEIGQGTTFKIYLPAIDTNSESPGKAVKPDGEQSESDGTETILLAEDDDMVRGLAKAILKQRGYKILVASNGNEALDILEKHDGYVDLLLTDLIMPEMNGRLLYKNASQKYPTLKVLYMSGYNEDAASHRAEPGKDFIQKPFSVQGLSAKVRQTLDSKEKACLAS